MTDLPEIKVLTLQEVADVARCHVSTVRRAVKSGDLTAFRRAGGTDKGKIFVLAEDALKWALGGKDPVILQTKEKEEKENV